jgi:hypothetical protein
MVSHENNHPRRRALEAPHQDVNQYWLFPARTAHQAASSYVMPDRRPTFYDPV